MNFILVIFYHYKKDDKIIEKEMFIQRVYGVITLEINIHDFTEYIFNPLVPGVH